MAENERSYLNAPMYLIKLTAELYHSKSNVLTKLKEVENEKLSIKEKNFYAYRIVGGYCDHRNSGGDASARIEQCPRKGKILYLR